MKDSIFDLLETVFPGIRGGVEDLRRLGVSWESVSTPFVAFEEDRLVSHVGLIELPLVVMGRPQTVGTVHAVATHPDHRHRGHYRRAMEALLSHAASRYETLILTTEHPEYFEPFGFRVVGEHGFTLRLSPPEGTAAASSRLGALGFRRMNLQDPQDMKLLHRLLETREPVSQVVGVRGEKAVFCFNEGRRPLYYAKDLDLMLCLEREGPRLRVYDVVSPSLPALDALLARMDPSVDEVEFGFSPDRFTSTATTTPRVFDHDGPSFLLVRGPFAAETEAFTLPRSART